MATRSDPGGYHLVDLRLAGRKTTHKVHHLVLKAFAGPRPEGMEGCHDDGRQANNHRENLYWGTRSVNMLDQVRHGTHQFAKRKRDPWGHLLLTPNIVAAKQRIGYRQCLACDRARSDQQRACKRGVADFDVRAAADRHYQRIMGVAS